MYHSRLLRDTQKVHVSGILHGTEITLKCTIIHCLTRIKMTYSSTWHI